MGDKKVPGSKVLVFSASVAGVKLPSEVAGIVSIIRGDQGKCRRETGLCQGSNAAAMGLVVRTDGFQDDWCRGSNSRHLLIGGNRIQMILCGRSNRSGHLRGY